MKKLIGMMLVACSVACVGPMGPPGEDGSDGKMGPPGVQGPAGLDGLDGKDGSVGATGPMGAPGKDGADARIVDYTFCTGQIFFDSTNFMNVEHQTWTLSSGDKFVQGSVAGGIGGTSVDARFWSPTQIGYATNNSLVKRDVIEPATDGGFFRLDRNGTVLSVSYKDVGGNFSWTLNGCQLQQY